MASITIKVKFIPRTIGPGNSTGNIGCHVIWAGIVNNKTNSVTNWYRYLFDSGIFIDKLFTANIVLPPSDNISDSDLVQCGDLRVRVVIIPCCSLSEQEMGAQAPPNTLPSTAVIQDMYIPVQQPIVNQCKRYVLPAITWTSGTSIQLQISGFMNCLIPSANPSGSTINIDVTNFKDKVFEFCLRQDANPVFNLVIDSVSQPQLTPTIQEYTDDSECCYRCKRYEFINTNDATTASFQVIYQDSGNGAIVNNTINISANSTYILNNIVQDTLVIANTLPPDVFVNEYDC